MDKIKVIDEKIAEEKKHIEDVENNIKSLEKEKQNTQVKNDEAYFCKNCKTFELKTDATPNMIKHQLCYKCNNKREHDERKKNVLQKFINSVIVDVEVTNWGTLKGIIVKNADRKVMKIGADYDDDEPFLAFDEIADKTDEYPSIVEVQIKPGMKPRTESPLSKFT